jgi:hypothetical protein
MSQNRAAVHLVELGEVARIEGLLHDLDVQDRLDAKIDKYVKRLLHLKGIKSLLAVSFSAPAKPPAIA